jgi:hypothetical protein
MFEKFKYYDPKGTTYVYWPHEEVGEISWRARRILNSREVNEIANLAQDADWLIETYFEGEARQARADIEEAGRWDLIEADEEGHFMGILPEAHEEFDIRDEDNTSKVEALEAALESIFDPENTEVKNPNDYEIVAAFALSKIEDYVVELDYERDIPSYKYKKKEKRDLDKANMRRLGQHLIMAMDAVGCAERLLKVSQVIEKYEKKLKNIEHQPPDPLIQKIKQDLMEEAKEKRRQDSIAKNDIRHERTRLLKKMVLEEYEKDPRRFNSSEEAGEHCREMLRSKGYSLTNRTVVGYVRARAKELGIRYR